MYTQRALSPTAINENLKLSANYHQHPQLLPPSKKGNLWPKSHLTSIHSSIMSLQHLVKIGGTSKWITNQQDNFIKANFPWKLALSIMALLDHDFQVVVAELCTTLAAKRWKGDCQLIMSAPTTFPTFMTTAAKSSSSHLFHGDINWHCNCQPTLTSELLMVKVKVLITTVVTVFNYDNNNKIILSNFSEVGKMFEFWKGSTLNKRL